jgi:nucleoside-diphosphate-sugar epimerase
MRTQNILITGILGYISREICEVLLKLDGRHNDLVKIYGFDNRFLPETVKWLVDNNIDYYERDIFNAKDLIEKADIIIHTAGQTAVPATKEQSTPEKDDLIKRTGTYGTQEILRFSKRDAKIIFFSTHVIFENLQEDLLVNEESEPCPILAYGTSKWQSEQDLRSSDRNFNILRLASIFGYNNNIRYSILPNLFSKKAALNQDLTVFGNGLNIKPLAGVNDLARFVAFLLLNYQRYARETFNFVGEHKTVKEIAEICQKYNPDIGIKFSNDAIINNGYRLDNTKILKTGFKFSQTVDKEIKNMIEIWKNK